MKADYSKVLERFGESPNTDSEEFMKMLSEFQTSLVESIKRCPHPLPSCVEHLKPKPKPTSPSLNKPKVRWSLMSIDCFVVMVTLLDYYLTVL